MHGPAVLLLFLGALLTSAGYGSTFLLTDHFRQLGGSEIDVGRVLAGAVAGTFVGVSMVGWLGTRFGGARLAALGAILVASGYFMLAALTTLGMVIALAGFLVGLGWGTFFLAAPMAISQRVTDADRGFWFTRFGVFQMAGIGAGPVLGMVLAEQFHLPTASIFRLLAAACCAAAACLWMFETVLPRPPAAGTRSASADPRAAGREANWIGTLGALVRTRALYPILMVGLGACVFSGMMTFQSSLVRAAGLNAGIYFIVYAIVVVAARFVLARAMGDADGDRVSVLLLVLMAAGVLAMFAIHLGTAIQILSAVLLGLGYGLVYTVIQTQAVNDAPGELRHGALTWFVISYFVGIFGFPVIGGWLIVKAGVEVFLVVVLACAAAELVLALVRRTVVKSA